MTGPVHIFRSAGYTCEMNTQPRETARRAFVSLLVISIFHGMNHTFSIFLTPLNENIRQFFGAGSISSVTAFKTTYLFLYAAGNLVFGLLTNRLSARRILAAGGILNGLAIIAFFFVPAGTGSLPVMHLLWALAGLGGGVYHPVANVLVTRLYPDRKGWAIGITGMGASTGFAFGPFLTGFLHGPAGFSWQDLSLLFGGVGLITAAAVFILVRDLPAHRPEAVSPGAGAMPEARTDASGGAHSGSTVKGFGGPHGSGRPADRNRGISGPLVVFLGYIILAVGLREIMMWSVLDITDFYLSEVHDAASGTAWYFFLMYLFGIFIQPAAGAFSDRLGRRRLASFSLLVHGLAVVLLALIPRGLLFLPFILIGIGQSGSVPTIEAMVADITTPRTRGAVYGFFITLTMGTGALGPLVSGLFIDSLGGTGDAYRLCFMILGALTSFAALMMSFSGLLRKRVTVPAA